MMVGVEWINCCVINRFWGVRNWFRCVRNWFRSVRNWFWSVGAVTIVA